MALTFELTSNTLEDLSPVRLGAHLVRVASLGRGCGGSRASRRCCPCPTTHTSPARVGGVSTRASARTRRAHAGLAAVAAPPLRLPRPSASSHCGNSASRPSAASRASPRSSAARWASLARLSAAGVGRAVTTTEIARWSGAGRVASFQGATTRARALIRLGGTTSLSKASSLRGRPSSKTSPTSILVPSSRGA